MRQYIGKDLLPPCPNTVANLACPLIPVDTKGRDMTFEQWEKCSRLKNF